jgi:hypothetical protein
MVLTGDSGEMEETPGLRKWIKSKNINNAMWENLIAFVWIGFILSVAVGIDHYKKRKKRK